MVICLLFLSITKWISPPQRKKSTKKGSVSVKSASENIKTYLRANKTLVTYVTAFIAANVACFSIRAYEYREVSNLACS